MITLPPILFNQLPQSVKEQYNDYQAGKLIHYTKLEQEFIWEDGSAHKYYKNDQISYQCIFINIWYGWIVDGMSNDFLN